MGLETRATQLTDSNQSENSRYPIYQSAKKVEANHYVHVTFPALFILAVLICFSVYKLLRHHIRLHLPLENHSIICIFYHKTIQRNNPPPGSPSLDLLTSSTSGSC